MINIGKDYRVTSNMYCWVLESRSDRVSKQGVKSDYWQSTFYPTLQQVARKVLDSSLKDMVVRQEVGSILEFEQQMVELAKELGDKLEKVSLEKINGDKT